MSSIDVFPNPKSLKCLNANLLCSLQYVPWAKMIPGFRPSSIGFSHPGRHSLFGRIGGLAVNSSFYWRIFESATFTSFFGVLILKKIYLEQLTNKLEVCDKHGRKWSQIKSNHWSIPFCSSLFHIKIGKSSSIPHKNKDFLQSFITWKLWRRLGVLLVPCICMQRILPIIGSLGGPGGKFSGLWVPLTTQTRKSTSNIPRYRYIVNRPRMTEQMFSETLHYLKTIWLTLFWRENMSNRWCTIIEQNDRISQSFASNSVKSAFR